MQLRCAKLGDMKTGILLWTVAIATSGLFGVDAQRGAGDYFLHYRVLLTAKGRSVPPVLDTSDKRLFRTRIREGAAKGAVFADHYAVATWGCGTRCLQFAIVDVRTGSVYLFPYSVSQDREDGELLTYRRNSRAMHIVGSLNEKDSADRWYMWEKDKLVLVSQRPARLLPDGVY